MDLIGDVRSGLRTLIHNPGFTAVAITMLALGIGVNATVFTVTDAVLFKGFPLVKRNDRLVYISGGGCCVSFPDYLDYRAAAKSFQGMGVTHGVGILITDQSGFTQSYSATEITAGTFPLVGVQPILGRDFTASDETPGAAPVAILHYGFWERRFGKDPAILGRNVRMNGVPTTIIGVMPAGFSFPQTADVWVPLVQNDHVMKRENRDTWFAFGRLTDTATFESARAEIEAVGKRNSLAYPLTNQDFHPVVQHFHEFFIGPNALLIYGSMLGAVGFVLLIACANLANLMLARAIGRSREISVRIALGAGRWRIIRQLLIESLLLSGLGGFLGWWVAKVCIHAYQLAMAAKSSWLIVDYSMDGRVLTYLVAVSIGTGLLFGLAPALRLSTLDVHSNLKDGARGASGGARGKHLTSLLVIGEMALAVVLLAGAGVMIRSFLKIHAAGMGVSTENILIGSFYLPPAKYPQADTWIAFQDRLKLRLEAIPGVESVAAADALPSWPTRQFPYEIAGSTPVDARRRPKLPAVTITPGYFETVRAARLEGRDFNEGDVALSSPVVIVNQRFASASWPGEDALGKKVRFFEQEKPGPWFTVIGVVSNIIQNDQSRQTFGPVAYLAYSQKPRRDMQALLRTQVPPETLTAAFRNEFRAVDPDLPIYGPFPLKQRLEFFWDSRFYGMIFLIFAAIALLLASIGLYTVIAHSVSQRTQEIGIRMAIGAGRRDILHLIFAQGLLPLAIGLSIGLAASFGVNRLLKSLLVQVSPWDPITLLIASATLILAALLGCAIPARRAMRVDPVAALRHE